MATKKQAKKEKVMIVEVPVPEAPTNPSKQRSALITLQHTEGWAVILKIMDDNIKYLENLILARIDPETGKRLTQEEEDDLRLKRDLNIELRNTPENYLERLGDIEETGKNFDPYYNIDELKRKQKEREN